MFLLDTNVISEVRKARPHGALLHWLHQVPSSKISLSAITIGELQAGVLKTRRNDPEKADELDLWIDALCMSHNVLPVDVAVAREWSKMMHGRSRTLMEDAMIAATAHVHGLTIATRNVKDFKIFQVPVFNPFEPVNPQ
jgi:predicted nucleic acid-binding protein